MTTNLKRIQVCADPDLAAEIKTLAKGRSLSVSAMAVELLKMAMKLSAVKEELEESSEKFGAVRPQEDPRIRLQQNQIRNYHDEVEANEAAAMKADPEFAAEMSKGISAEEVIKMFRDFKDELKAELKADR